MYMNANKCIQTPCNTPGPEAQVRKPVPEDLWYMLSTLLEQQNAVLHSKLDSYHVDLCKIIADGNGDVCRAIAAETVDVTDRLEALSKLPSPLETTPRYERLSSTTAVENREAAPENGETANAQAVRKLNESHTVKTLHAPAAVKVSMHDAFMRAKGWHRGQSDAEEEDSHAPPNSLCLRLQHMIEHPVFEGCLAFLIVLNTLVLIMQMEYRGAVASVSLGLRKELGWADADWYFDLGDNIFNAIFCLELVVRISIQRLRFFTDMYNLLDFVIVLMVQMEPLLTLLNINGTNLTFARLLRLGRVARIFKVIRVMHVFRQLRIVLETIVASVSALAWSMVILFVIMLCSALFLCQALHGHIMDENKPQDLREWMYSRYGSATRATWTMFELTLSGGWPAYARPLVEQVSPFYVGFFVFYVAGVQFAVIRIISALFLRETLNVANNDQALIQEAKEKKKMEQAENLRIIFAAAETSGDGVVNQEEFANILANENFVKGLADLELRVSEVAGLFQLLDDGDGTISFDEFVSGVLRLKGAAQSVDVVTLLYENQKSSRKLHALCEAIAHIDSEMHVLLASPKAKQEPHKKVL